MSAYLNTLLMLL